jgi:SAM-dependent methyltransferase
MIDYDQIAAEYARHRQVHPGVLESLCQAVTGVSRVLEVGCGTGNYIVALELLVGCPCWGIDPSAEMLSQAEGRSPTIRSQIARAEYLALASGAFDLVFSVDVIHHIDDRSRYMHEAYRVLVPGGRICTTTDSEWIIRHRQPLATYFPETIQADRARYPRITELRAHMERAGFDEIVEHTVECPYHLADIQAYRDKAFSALHLIPDEAFRRGIARMERDLLAGPIPCISRYTLLWGRKATSHQPERQSIDG